MKTEPRDHGELVHFILLINPNPNLSAGPARRQEGDACTEAQVWGTAFISPVHVYSLPPSSGHWVIDETWSQPLPISTHPTGHLLAETQDPTLLLLLPPPRVPPTHLPTSGVSPSLSQSH